MAIFRSLKTKFALGVSLLLIFIFLGQTLINIRATESRLIGEVNQEVKTFSQLSTRHLIEAYEEYYFSGFHKFREIVEDMWSLSPNTSRIRLVDMEGKIRFDTKDLKLKEIEELEIVNPFLLEEVRKGEPSYIYEDEKKNIFEEIIYPFLDELGRHEYSLIYSVSYEIIEKETSQAMIRTVFLALLLLILSITLVSFLTIRMTGPISELEEGTRIIGRGNLDYRMRIETGDEIESLANEFNKMTEKLKESMEKLEEAKIGLEIRVKERTQELEEEKNKTLAIITNFSDGLLVFDKENNLLLINPKAEISFEIKAKEIIGKSISELTKIPTLKSLIDLLGEEIKKIFRKEFQLKENLILELTTTPLMREKKKIGTLVILHDVTREKIIERLKTEFVSLSAHQLRTPLSAIKWTLRMLLDGDVGEITKEQKDLLEKTYRSNERMINLINDLLNVARIEEGRYVYRPIFADIEKIIQSVIDSFKTEIEIKNIKFKFNKPIEKLPEILMDVEKMKLVIENLLDNAIRYTLSGGEVTVSITRGIKEAEFKVQDSGVGIPEDQQKRIFSKFFRGANIMRMETEGTGLGLFITKNIIEAHGGKIWFESKEGKGTTFYFTLPIRGVE